MWSCSVSDTRQRIHASFILYIYTIHTLYIVGVDSGLAITPCVDSASIYSENNDLFTINTTIQKTMSQISLA